MEYNQHYVAIFVCHMFDNPYFVVFYSSVISLSLLLHLE